jgi:hypothetical protein
MNFLMWRTDMRRSLLTIVVCASALLLASCANLPHEPERTPLSLEQIVDLAKSGKDAQTIIKEIKDTRAVYDITASQYAKLSRDGVPDAVLDHMQLGQLKMAERAGRREALDDAWLYGRGWGWGYGGLWAPRPYGIWISGRYYRRSF